MLFTSLQKMLQYLLNAGHKVGVSFISVNAFACFLVLS